MRGFDAKRICLWRTDFMGRNLIMELVRRKYAVQALARHGSEHKLPHGCKVIPGDALDKNSVVLQIPPAETFVQLIGVTHPNPAKKDEFRAVDLGSARAVDRCGARGRRPPFRVRQRGAARSHDEVSTSKFAPRRRR